MVVIRALEAVYWDKRPMDRRWKNKTTNKHSSYRPVLDKVSPVIVVLNELLVNSIMYDENMTCIL